MNREGGDGGEPGLLDRPEPVRSGEELDTDRLRAHLAQHLPEASGSLVVQQFPRGYSNLTYLVRMGPREMVLRRPPFAAQAKGGHDMGREYRVLSRLWRIYPPAPRPYLCCEDPSVLGVPFYLMERKKGMVVRTAFPAAVASNAQLVRAVCNALWDNLADLHAIDYQGAGLADLGRPDGYVRRQIEGWTLRYAQARTGSVPEMDDLGRWLAERIPEDGPPALIHNDYKFDNVMLDPDDLTRVVAVLDWEMCTIGDPLMDLGTSLSYWLDPDDDPTWKAHSFAPTYAAGAPTRAEVVERYAVRTGRDPSNMLYYYVYGLFKLAVIVQQIFFRFARGFTRDARFAGLDDKVVACARTAVRAVERGRY
jgi:aminoglycoside phosphotransferase (APT) family kinase protein